MHTPNGRASWDRGSRRGEDTTHSACGRLALGSRSRRPARGRKHRTRSGSRRESLGSSLDISSTMASCSRTRRPALSPSRPRSAASVRRLRRAQERGSGQAPQAPRWAAPLATPRTALQTCSCLLSARRAGNGRPTEGSSGLSGGSGTAPVGTAGGSEGGVSGGCEPPL